MHLIGWTDILTLSAYTRRVRKIKKNYFITKNIYLFLNIDVIVL